MADQRLGQSLYIERLRVDGRFLVALLGTDLLSVDVRLTSVTVWRAFPKWDKTCAGTGYNATGKRIKGLSVSA